MRDRSAVLSRCSNGISLQPVIAGLPGISSPLSRLNPDGLSSSPGGTLGRHPLSSPRPGPNPSGRYRPRTDNTNSVLHSRHPLCNNAQHRGRGDEQYLVGRAPEGWRSAWAIIRAPPRLAPLGVGYNSGTHFVGLHPRLLPFVQSRDWQSGPIGWRRRPFFCRLPAVLKQVQTISRMATLSLIVCAYLITSFAGLTHEISHATAHGRMALRHSPPAIAGRADTTIAARTESPLGADQSASLCFFCTFSFGTLVGESVSANAPPVDAGIRASLADNGSPTVHSLHHPSLRAPPVQG